jgi:hypothetical protein
MSERTDLSLYNNNIKDYLDVIKDLDATKVPARYIEKIVLTFEDDSIIELSGEEFTNPIPVEGNIRWEEIKNMFQNIKSMKLHLNVFMIEYDLEERLLEIYGGMIDVF